MHGHTFGHWPFGGRMFRKGAFRYKILDMVKDKPTYGYEIIRQLEDQFGGMYIPSAGIVYPTLQYFEELGYVTSAEKDGKKFYTITQAGLKHLEEQKETIDDIKEQMKSWSHGHGREEFRDMMQEWGRLGRLCGRSVRYAKPEDLKRIREIIEKAYGDIEKIIKH